MIYLKNSESILSYYLGKQAANSKYFDDKTEVRVLTKGDSPSYKRLVLSNLKRLAGFSVSALNIEETKVANIDKEESISASEAMSQDRAKFYIEAGIIDIDESKYNYVADSISWGGALNLRSKTLTIPENWGGVLEYCNLDGDFGSWGLLKDEASGLFLGKKKDIPADPYNLMLILGKFPWYRFGYRDSNDSMRIKYRTLLSEPISDYGRYNLVKNDYSEGIQGPVSTCFSEYRPLVPGNPDKISYFEYREINWAEPTNERYGLTYFRDTFDDYLRDRDQRRRIPENYLKPFFAEDEIKNMQFFVANISFNRLRLGIDPDYDYYQKVWNDYAKRNDVVYGSGLTPEIYLGNIYVTDQVLGSQQYRHDLFAGLDSSGKVILYDRKTGLIHDIEENIPASSYDQSDMTVEYIMNVSEQGKIDNPEPDPNTTITRVVLGGTNQIARRRKLIGNKKISQYKLYMKCRDYYANNYSADALRRAFLIKVSETEQKIPAPVSLFKFED